MKAEDILSAFLKYAAFAVNQPSSQAPAAIAQQPNLAIAPLATGQPPKRTVNVATDPTGETNGNTASTSAVKPTTNPSKGLKTSVSTGKGVNI